MKALFKHIARILFAFALLLGEAGCGPAMKDGVVEGHGHRNAFTTHSFIMAGKVMVPTTQYHPEQWLVRVHGLNKEGQLDTQWVHVPKSTYDHFNEGDSIHFDLN